MFATRSHVTLALIVLLALLLLVAARPGESARPDERYVVQPGDTLWAIAAAEYGGDPREAIWRIEKRNDLAGGPLVPGDVLTLPH
jgi:nucleoid-associated protein YgaU